MRDVRIMVGLFLTCVVVMFMCSCRRESKYYYLENGSSEIDADNDMIHINNHLAAHRNSLYFFQDMFDQSSRYLCYYDCDSDTGGILCGKPQCNHNSTSCNAYLGEGNKWGPVCYNNKIYWIADEEGKKTLYCCALDGSEHRKVFVFKDQEHFPTGNTFFTIHRGLLILSGGVDRVVDGVFKPRRTVLICPLEGNGKSEVIYEDDDQYFGVYIPIFVKDETLYYACCNSSTEAEKKLLVYEFSLKDWSSEIVLEKKIQKELFEFKMKGRFFCFSCVNDGNIYVFDKADVPSDMEILCDFNLENKTEFGYIWINTELFTGYTLDSDGRIHIRIYDNIGTLISDYYEDSGNDNLILSVIEGVHDQNLIIAFWDQEENIQTLVLYQMNALNALERKEIYQHVLETQ